MNSATFYFPGSNSVDLNLMAIQYQIDAAINHSVEPGLAPGELVFELRKGTKRVKALFQMFKPLMQARNYYSIEEKISQSGRILSEQRDASVNLLTFQELITNSRLKIAEKTSQHINDILKSHVASAYNNKLNALNNRIIRYAFLLNKVRGQLNTIEIERADANFFLNNLDKSFRSAHSFLKHADYRPETEILHSWRKSLKRLLLQLKFSPVVSPGMIGISLEILNNLTEMLGREHDLAMLADTVNQITITEPGDKKEILYFINAERNHILKASLSKAKEVFSGTLSSYHHESIMV